MHSVIGDLRDAAILTSVMQTAQPEIVFHLAAQPLVRHSYADPVGTYETNVLGTIHLLEAVRKTPSVRAVVIVTTDKCYENKEWIWPYRETDPLGGYDPYSSSKACAEIVTSSWRDSFFNPARYAEHHVAIASARAGNVIGGGDWASDRLIADIVRAFSSGKTLEIRNPAATRPWQHVLEPLRGYLTLAEKLHADGVTYASAWNFGPHYTDAQPVEWIVRYLSARWGSATQWKIDTQEHVHEAQMLKLDWSKAHAALGWQPVLLAAGGARLHARLVPARGRRCPRSRSLPGTDLQLLREGGSRLLIHSGVFDSPNFQQKTPLLRASYLDACARLSLPSISWIRSP